MDEPAPENGTPSSTLVQDKPSSSTPPLAPGATPGVLDMSSKVKLSDGKEVTLGELAYGYQEGQRKVQGLEQQNRALRQVQDAAFTLMDPESADDEERSGAVRVLLQAAGAEPEEIERAVQPKQATPGGDQVEQPSSQPQSYEDPVARKHIREMRLQQLNEQVDNAVSRALGSHESLQKVLGKAADKGKAQEMIRGSVRQHLIERLNERSKLNNGRFDFSWIGEEGQKAAEAAMAPLSAVIGDPDQLGRSSETVTGPQALKDIEKVPLPEFDLRKTPGQIQKETKDFIASEFQQMALESFEEGSTKV